MTNLNKCIFLFCVSFYVALARHEFYEGHALYEVIAKDAEQASFVNGLENQLPIDIFMYANLDRAAQILVPKNVRPEFEAVLSAQEVDYKINVENIREQLEMEDQLLAAAQSKSSGRSSNASIGLNFNAIHRFQVVDDYLVRLAAAYPDTVTLESAGYSVEGRDMKYLKISTTNFEDTSKPVVFLMSLLHAREWVTLPGTLYAIEKLVLDVEEEDLLNTIDWIILPIANPDGYEFSHTGNRFWRKNRARGFMIGDICMGVDLNRNFDAFWGASSSSNVCAETFHGHGPFSEPETTNINRIVQAHEGRIELFIDLHSFGSMILYGFGNGEFPPNVFGIHLNAVNQAQAIDKAKWQSKPNYIVGNVFHVLYPASGISSDFMQLSGIPYSYTYELPAWRGVQGSLNGFLIDQEFILQAGVETWEGIKTGARFTRDNLLMSKSGSNLK